MKRNFTGQHFWARGYCVSTVGLDVEMIRDYIRNQEKKRSVRNKCTWLVYTDSPLGDFIKLPALRVVHDLW